MIGGMTQKLAPNPDNPRTISAEKLEFLKRALQEFGDLGGIVYNRKTKRLVGGHQRSHVFGKDSKVVVERKYQKPTKTGTVAEGYVMVSGERFAYREVSWDDVKEKAANIAANRGAGEWDQEKLKTMFHELADFGFDLDLTLFSDHERSPLFDLGKKKRGATHDSGEGKRDVVKCPNCGYIKGLTPGIRAHD